MKYQRPNQELTQSPKNSAFFRQKSIYPKLNINAPNDRYEQEADQMADQVMSIKQTTDSPPAVQRKCAACEQEDEKVQRKSHEATHQSPNSFEGNLNATKGEGTPLPKQTHDFMSQAFQHDFSQVRVHNNRDAHQMNEQIQAKAFTHGNDIYFNQNEYQPDSSNGQKLLAHELTHVVQQTQAKETIQRFNWENAGIGAGIGGLAGGLLGAGIGGILGGGMGALIGGAIGLGVGALAGLAIGGSISRRKFDALIDHANTTLTLVMKIKFHFSDEVDPWPNQEAKDNWVRDFKQKVENRWSYRYYLVKQSGNCPDVHSNLYFAKVNIIPVDDDPHYNVTVRNTSTFQQSYVNQGNNTAVYDSLDNQRRSDINQVPSEHEFGHMLGLPHIHCDSNDDECYGVTPEEQRDVMGRGSVVSVRDYQPFVDAINDLTGCTWIATHERPAPVGDFPEPDTSRGVYV